MALNIIVGKFPDFQGRRECIRIGGGGSDQILPGFVSKSQIPFYRC